MKAFIPIIILFVMCSCTANQFAKITKPDGTSVIVYNGGSVETKSTTENHTSDVKLASGDTIHFDSTIQNKDETSLSGGYFLWKTTTNAADNLAHTKNIKNTFDGKAKLKGTKDPNIIPKDPNTIPLDPNVPSS